ncbi:MAG: GH3 auxin-responsive promoter family protein, partial [Anaerolineae bacterium]|nr:GH3 auxin-responsive promoter family protein [Anaerolineae bacterium]
MNAPVTVTDEGAAQMSAMLGMFLQGWHRALEAPEAAQEQVLQKLLAGYAQNEYGRRHGAAQIGSVAEYRARFPVQRYTDYRPVLRRVMAGATELFLGEPPVGWAMTRGTTGASKYIPMTPADLELRRHAARAVMQYALTSGRFEALAGANLNLSFPSVIGRLQVNDKLIDVGYATGIYVRHVAATSMIQSIPTQDEIDALGSGTGRKAWDARFELAYQRAQGEHMTVLGGACQVMLKFGHYLYRTHRVLPKDVWQIGVISAGSTAGIHTTFAPRLRAYYGAQAGIVEIYGATEGIFGQQRDARKLWSPNYDLFFFEALVGDTIKMLHEMRPGETGALVVSTPVLPRYRIGDLIRAFDPPYFRCIGRE